MSQFMNQDHQSDRQSINLTTPPIFNSQGKSTLAHLQKDFCPRQKLLIPKKYRRYIRRVETYIGENYKQLGIQNSSFTNTKMEQLFPDSVELKEKGERLYKLIKYRTHSNLSIVYVASNTVVTTVKLTLVTERIFGTVHYRRHSTASHYFA